VTPADPADVRAEVDRLLAERTRTQPLNIPSCGSVFKNPEGDFAGRLIEAAGLKGEREGSAQISPLHANFIANTGGATAADVHRLMERAREAVEKTSGVRLEPEVRLVGRPN
jgi:UDP-N-acetylmuramate dehydrogenase